MDDTGGTYPLPTFHKCAYKMSLFSLYGGTSLLLKVPLKACALHFLNASTSSDVELN